MFQFFFLFYELVDIFTLFLDGLLLLFTFHVVFGLITLKIMIWRQNRKCISILFFLVWISDISEIIRTRFEMRKYSNGLYIPISKYPKILNIRSKTKRVSERPSLYTYKNELFHLNIHQSFGFEWFDNCFGNGKKIDTRDPTWLQKFALPIWEIFCFWPGRQRTTSCILC